MVDREKVIKALEHCAQVKSCDKCPMGDECTGTANAAMAAAVELLKAQEPRVLTLEEAMGGDECWFEHINGSSGYADVYCHWNGVVWVSRINKIISMIQAETYGKQWRCWNYRPTDEQRKAVKWND